MKFKLLFILSGLFFWSSCQSDYIYGPGGVIGAVDCDTIDVAYTTHIKPIIEEQCVFCHTGNNASGSVPLEDYNKVKAAVENSGLSAAVNYEPGKSKMPPSGKLDECSLDIIRIWIEGGLQE